MLSILGISDFRGGQLNMRQEPYNKERFFWRSGFRDNMEVGRAIFLFACILICISGIINPMVVTPSPLLICGIDEVGRGPWAGPVIAAAVILPPKLPNFFMAVTDSKKLSTAQREKLYPLLMECCQVGIGQSSVEEIDQYNILQATMFAMQRAFQALPTMPNKALVDGNRAPKLPCVAEAIIGGDAKIPAIAAASIIAKVTRDRMMANLHKEFPYYGWDTNAGYGTATHQAGLSQRGITPHHRRSFAPIKAVIAEKARIASEVTVIEFA